MIHIYLDTSFLSELSKVTSTSEQGDTRAKKWASLLNALRRGVNSGLLICPASQFQTQEAKLAGRLLDSFASLQHELSLGTYFREFQEILVHQTVNQLLKYIGRPQDIDLGWEPFTKKHPAVVDTQTTLKMKSDLDSFANITMSPYAPKTSYDEQYNAEKVSFLQNSFLQPIRQLLGLPTFSETFDPTLLSMLMEEAQITQGFLQFFDSSFIDLVPFIHIFCSIFASLRFHEPKRKYTGSEREDAVALACAMSYCQIITTDANMRTNIVDRLHLDKKYGVSVFNPRQDQLDALEHLISDKLSTK